MRWGYTTGACAAAAAKAAIASVLCGKAIPEATLTLPGGERADFRTWEFSRSRFSAHYAVVKDGGDDPDVTHGLLICAKVQWSVVSGQWSVDESMDGGADILIGAGEGVGIVTRKGLPVPVGQAAINPVPQQMIRQAVLEVLANPSLSREGGNKAVSLRAPYSSLVEVTISVPGGEEIAKGTFNPKLGIKGGISILGTTGRVRPMSVCAWRSALSLQLDTARSSGHQLAVLVPGNIGEKAAKRLGFPETSIIHTSNHLGWMLEQAVDRGFGEILLLGHVGKLSKVADGFLDTHYEHAPFSPKPFIDIALKHKEHVAVGFLKNAVSGEEAAMFLRERGLNIILEDLSIKISEVAGDSFTGQSKIGTILINLAGDMLAGDIQAKTWLRSVNR